MTEEIIDGVKITTDDFGNLYFESINLLRIDLKVTRSWFSRIIDWFTTSRITPYVKVRDISDPIGKFASGDNDDINPNGPKGIEAGIKIKF